MARVGVFVVTLGNLEGNMRILFLMYIALFLSACTQTENGLVFGTPDYEKRSIDVSQTDLKILLKTKELLDGGRAWRKGWESGCSDVKKYNLYCALEKASITVMGEYVHRQAALQEVRFAIDDDYRARWSKHRLVDFNSHSDTAFKDVQAVLARALERVEGKLANKPD